MQEVDVPTQLILLSAGATAAMRRAAFPDNDALDQRGLSDVEAAADQAPKTVSGDCPCSPMASALATCRALGYRPVEVAALADQNAGQWKGRRLKDIARQSPDALAAWLTDPDASAPGGETFAAVRLRVARWLATLAEQPQVVAVTHPCVIRAVLIDCLDIPLASFPRIQVPPLTQYRFVRSSRGWEWSRVETQ